MKRLLLFAALSLALVPVSSCSLAKPRKMDVIVAARDLYIGRTIVERDIDIIRIDDGTAPKGVPRRRSDVIGHEVLRPIIKGELILPAKLSAEARVEPNPILISPVQ